MSEPFGSGWGNYSIQGIVEIQFPEPIDLWPQTPGWWLLLFGLLAWAANRIVHALKRRWRNRYRGLAIEKLAGLRHEVEAGDPKALRKVPELVKSVALQAFPRTDIAELSGEAWEVFLDGSYSGPSFAQKFPGMLYTLSYRSVENLEEPVSEQFWSQVQLWIATHRGGRD
jgi:hypothetical protein